MTRIVNALILGVIGISICCADDAITGPQAWSVCVSARVSAHSVNPNAGPASNSLAKAGAAVASVPDKFRSSFQSTYDQLARGMATSQAVQNRGVGERARGDGAYGVIKARVDAGNWLGVTVAATSCANTYHNAASLLRTAQHGYGQVKSGSDNLVAEIRRFLAMLDAFEDFYGPIP